MDAVARRGGPRGIGAGRRSSSTTRACSAPFSGLGALLGRKKSAAPAPVDPGDRCPDWWFPAGFLVLGPIVVALMAWLFRIPVWAGVIAVPLAVLKGFVAARDGRDRRDTDEGARPR